MNNELAYEILNLCYEQWFKDYLIGISIQTFISKLSYPQNEILKTLEILQNRWIVEKDDIGGYIITVSGIDIYEENLLPSKVSKIIAERKIILDILKEEYDKDINRYTNRESLKSRIQIEDNGYLSGLVEYLNRKNPVKLEKRALGGKFLIKLSPVGFESFQDQTFNTALSMKNAYFLLFKVENKLRQFIEVKMVNKYGSEWWNIGITPSLRNKVDQMRKDELKVEWIVTNTKSSIEYLSFDHLQNLIINNWKDVFESVFHDQDKIKLKLKELEIIRNAIAHTRTLSNDGMNRLEQYTDDIFNLIRT